MLTLSTLTIPADFVIGQRVAIIGGVAAPATKPAAPTIGLTKTESGTLTFSLADGADGGAAITGHRVWASTTQGFVPADGNLAASLGAAATSFVLSGLANGTRIYVRVAAINSVGVGSYSAEASGTPTAGTPPPGGVSRTADRTTTTADTTTISADRS